MSRYSPGVVPQYGPSFTEMLANALQTYKRDRDDNETRDINRRAADVSAVSQGFRPGAIPKDQGRIDPRTAMADPFMQRSAIEMMGKMAPAGGRPAEAPAPGGAELAAAIQAPQGPQGPQGPPTPRDVVDTPPQPSFIRTGAPAQPEAGSGGAGAVPGAFDPNARAFGTGVAGVLARAERPAPPERIPVKGGYMDMSQTPRADAARDRQTQLQLAAMFRSNDINQKGDQAKALEDQKQTGRNAIRSSINSNNLVGISLRAMLTGQNEAAHDSRTATTGQAHDERVSARVGPAADKPAAEANRLRMATAVIDAAGGGIDGYQAGLDWLRNDPAGQDAAKHGLREDHFYAGLGAWNKHQQDLRVGMESATAGKPVDPDLPRPDVVGGARQPGVTRPAPAGTPTGMAGARRAKPTGGGTPDASKDASDIKGSALQTITKDEADELKKLGYTDDQIAKKYIISK